MTSDAAPASATTPRAAAAGRPLRVGLIGCGGFGTRGHLRALPDLAERATVVATADPDSARARAAADQVGAERAVTDFHDLLGDVDAVIVATPHDRHHDIAAAALDAGKHVLVEKPLANTEAECLDLIDRADRAQRVLMVGYVLRYNPMVKRFRSLLVDRTYGSVFHLTLNTEQYLPVPEGHWRADEARRGGGGLFSHGCHYVDVLLWTLGRPVRGAHLDTHEGTPWSQVETTSHTVIEFEGGILGHHFATEGARALKGQTLFRAHCTEGIVQADLTSRELTVATRDGQEVLEQLAPGKHLVGELAHFFDCIESPGTRPLTDGRRALQSLRAIWHLQDASAANAFADLAGLGLDDA